MDLSLASNKVTEMMKKQIDSDENSSLEIELKKIIQNYAEVQQTIKQKMKLCDDITTISNNFKTLLIVVIEYI